MTITSGHEAGPDSTAGLMRRWLIALAALGTVGTAIELAFLRHWDNGLQLVPFVALAALAVAVLLVVVPPSATGIRTARVIACGVLITALIGVFVHVRANYEAAPLDVRYTASWPTTAEPVRWFLAFTDTVGQSPSLSPLAMAFVAVVLLLATIRHPALRSLR